MEAGATSSRKEARGAKLVRRLLALLGRDQAAVGVDVDLVRCSPPDLSACSWTCITNGKKQKELKVRSRGVNRKVR